jgi:hypothetical protein
VEFQPELRQPLAQYRMHPLGVVFAREQHDKVVATMLRFPRLGPPERCSPTSAVLSEHYDFLRRIRGCLYFRFPAPTDPLRVRSRAAEISARAWSRSSPVPLAIVGRSNTGPPRFLENPSHTFAPL